MWTIVSKRFLMLIISALAISVLTTVNFVYALPYSNAPPDDNSVITIQSPQNGATYNVTSLPLYFMVQSNYSFFSVRYILNNYHPVTIPAWVINQTSLKGYFPGYDYTYFYPRFTAVSNTVLRDLSNGVYKLTIESFYHISTGVQIANSTSITFTVDTAYRNATAVFHPISEPYPELTVGSFSSPTKNVATNNEQYAQVDFVFSLNVIPSWVGYSIDGRNNQTISDFSAIYNIQAFINVPLGSHTVTLYAKDTSGNWAAPVTFCSTVISFEDYVAGKSASNSLLAPSVSPSPVPTVPELSCLVTVTLFLSLFSVTVILRFRKNNKNR